MHDIVHVSIIRIILSLDACRNLLMKESIPVRVLRVLQQILSQVSDNVDICVVLT